MSNYVIATDVNGTFYVASGTIDSTQTSLKLVGRAASGYGIATVENDLKLASNFASPTEPNNPLIGQLWYDSSNQGLRVYTGPVDKWCAVSSENSQLWKDVTASDLTAFVKTSDLTAFAQNNSPIFTGVVTVPEGSLNSPGLVFTNDGLNDTGLYHISDGVFGIGCNQVSVAVFSSTGANLKGAPTAPTPIATSNSTEIATTEFVKRHGVAYSSDTHITANTTLDSTHIGGLVTIGGAGSIVATLLDTSLISKGNTITFFSTSANNSVKAPGTDKIYVNGSTVTSIALGAGDSLILESLNNGYWQAIGGTAQLPYSAVMSGANWTTPAAGDSSKKLATTEFVVNAVSGSAVKSALGFTPVQQGTGGSQTSNLVKIGWSSAGVLRLEVDTTDFGANWPINITGIAAGLAATANPTIAGLTISGASSNYITLFDQDFGSRYIHHNNGLVGFLKSDGNWACISYDSGDFGAVGNITSRSDETVKANWADLPSDFIPRLALVKHGSFDRTDIKMRQVGVSAQSLEQVLPEAVTTDQDGIKSVAYGHAALTCVIELSAVVVEMQKTIKSLKKEIQQLRNKNA